MGRSDMPFSTGSLLKVVMAVALVAITLGLVLSFNEALARYAASGYLMLAVDGAVVLAMAYLSIRIFGRL